MKNLNHISIFRWTARILGVFLVFITLVFFFGLVAEGYNKTGKITPEDFNAMQIATFFFWFLCLAGIIWAWWNEKAGGILSFGSTVIFLILAKVNAVTNPEASVVPVLFVFLIPSILFLICWWLKRK
jgi:hypothetical protein